MTDTDKDQEPEYSPSKTPGSSGGGKITIQPRAGLVEELEKEKEAIKALSEQPAATTNQTPSNPLIGGTTVTGDKSSKTTT